MRALWDAILDLLLPRACARCGRGVAGNTPVCERCTAAIPRLPAGSGPPPSKRLAALVCEVAFDAECADWIRRFKYPSRGLAGLDARPIALCASLLADSFARLEGPPPELLVPVPIHPRRLRERGFHPAGLLARALARSTGIPWDRHALIVTRETASQTGLDRSARRRNVRGAFAAADGRRPPRSVALVDDVVTTGATLAECAGALERVGARRVVAVCVARTV